MFVVTFEIWRHGNREDIPASSELRICNLGTSDDDVADYEVQQGVGAPTFIVRSHRRGDGYFVLAHKALSAILRGHYNSAYAKMPPSILRLLPEAPYCSRACLWGQRVAASTDPQLHAELRALDFPSQDEYAQLLHSMCRRTDKQSGNPCTCECHQ